MKKIIIIVNKNWETEPVLNALTNSEIRPKELPFPNWINSPKDGTNRMNAPRAFWRFAETLQVTLWCIQDLMNPGKSSSSSEEKFRVLPEVISKENPDLVIAVGTAGYPVGKSSNANGCVVIGSNFLLYDGHPGNPNSNLTHKDIGKLLSSNVNEKLFDIFSDKFISDIQPGFLKVPNNPCNAPTLMAFVNNAALSNINVTDYNEYGTIDHPGVDAKGVEYYNQVAKDLPLASVETTHGVIRISTDKPVIFVSAIADRLGYFDKEVTPGQNYIASFNSGIVLGKLICSLKILAAEGFDFRKQN